MVASAHSNTECGSQEMQDSEKLQQLCKGLEIALVNLKQSVSNRKSSKARRRRSQYNHSRVHRLSRCSICKKRFFKSLMNKHQIKCIALARLRCKVCHFQSKSQERLAEHYASQCDTLKVFECDVCYKRYQYKRLLNIHRDPICITLRSNFKCEICEKSFKRRKSKSAHMAVHGIKLSVQKIFLCEVCGKTGPNRNLYDHLRRHSDERLFSCNKCSKSFKTRNNLNKHKKIHSEKKPYKCAECEKSFRTRAVLSKHMGVHGMVIPTSISLTCKICGKEFLRKQNLTEHMRRHTGEMPYDCTVCGKKYLNKQHLTEHMQRHAGKMPFDCTVCGKKYLSKRRFTEHVRRHTVAMAHDCTVCGKANLSKKHLTEHMRVHTEEKPYCCETCRKQFSTARNLRRHSYTHISNYPCEVCGKYFQTQFKLFDHLRLHTGEMPYDCKLCGKYFRTIRNFKAHNYIHLAERPHTCEFCNESFRIQSQLLIHRSIHTGELLYECKDCGTKFGTRGRFRYHRKKVCIKSIRPGDIKEDVSEVKPYICNECGQAFNKIDDLESHNSFLHSERKFSGFEERIDDSVLKECDLNLTVNKSSAKTCQQTFRDKSKYICKVCGKGFSFMSRLNRHLPTHNSRTHICSECSKGFKTERHLNQHKVTHMSQKLFACQFCTLSFNLRNELNQHLLVHIETSTYDNVQGHFMTPSQEESCICKKCGKLYSSPFHLAQHFRQHTNNFTCTTCGKIFSKNYKLVEHLRLHTGEKPFHCNLCGKSFTRVSSLNRHVKKKNCIKQSLPDDNRKDLFLENYPKPIISGDNNNLMVEKNILTDSAIQIIHADNNTCSLQKDVINNPPNNLDVLLGLKHHTQSNLKDGTYEKPNPIKKHIASEAFSSKIQSLNNLKGEHSDDKLNINEDNVTNVKTLQNLQPYYTHEYYNEKSLSSVSNTRSIPVIDYHKPYMIMSATGLMCTPNKEMLLEDSRGNVQNVIKIQHW